MNMIKYITVIFLFLALTGCTDQKKKDEEQIKETVQKFWTAVQNNDEEGYLSLIENSGGEYRLAMLDQLHYLNRNYSKINQKIKAQGIQIKDTNELGPSQKAVEYLFDKPGTTVEPLTVKLFFFQEQGYQTIFNIRILGNLPEWEK